MVLDADLDYIRTRSDEKTFKAGEMIFNRGAAAIHFYIVKSGEIEINQADENGQNIILARFVAGNSFGEFDFITNSLYDVEARALIKSTLLLFPGFPHTFESLTNENPDVIMRLYLHSLFLLSNRLRSVHTLIAENTTWIKHIQNQLYTDQLTGLYTRLYLKREISRFFSYPVAFLMIKPDRFKQLNDIFGHKAGDAVLSRIAAAVMDIVRDKESGWAVRLRGNEIVLILNHTETEKALAIAKSLALKFQDIGPGRIYTSYEKKLKSGKKESFQLTATISIGIFRRIEENWKRIFSDTYNLMTHIWSKGGNEISVLGVHDKKDF